MSRRSHLIAAGRWNVMISLLAFIFFFWQFQGKMFDTPAAVIFAGVGSIVGLLAGYPAWRRMPHLSYKGKDVVEDRRAHFKGLLVKLSRWRVMCYIAALIWMGQLLYQLGKAMTPDGSITEARASNKLNNGVVALMFVVATTLSLGYGNLRQAHNISNVLDKVHLQLDRMGNLGRP